jgi:hypothetical protein
MESDKFNQLISFLSKVPAVEPGISSGLYEDGNWWVKFSLNISNELAWNVIQEFGHVFNYLSIDQKLPTAFYPVSPPPYLNGGPSEFLSWIVESKDSAITPNKAKGWLESRLPDPIEDINEWVTED